MWISIVDGTVVPSGVDCMVYGTVVPSGVDVLCGLMVAH